MVYGVKWISCVPLAALALSAWAVSGHAAEVALMDMKIESVAASPNSDHLTTTGAEFILDRQNDAIICWQRIPQRREVATIRGLSLNRLKLLSRDTARCAFGATQDKEALTVSADSLLTVCLAAGAELEITGSYEPAWKGIEGNHLLLPDETGGVALYLIGDGQCERPMTWTPGWKVRYRATSESRLLVSVFPPRPFDWKQSGETMLHSFSCNRPYPSDEELTTWRKIGSILTLHSFIWQGSAGSTYGKMDDAAYSTSTYTPKSEAEMLRVVGTAHRLGMKVIPYVTPCYFGNINGTSGRETMPRFLERVKFILGRYGFDGIYSDGLYANDIEGSYELARSLREMIGNQGILHVHCTILPLYKIYCPFIDCYATYILRGENRRLDDEKCSARWMVSSYNLGNSIGLFCYDTGRISSNTIDRLLSINARVPYWVQEGTSAFLVEGKYYCLTGDEVKLMDAEYFPKLQKSLRASGVR